MKGAGEVTEAEEVKGAEEVTEAEEVKGAEEVTEAMEVTSHTRALWSPYKSKFAGKPFLSKCLIVRVSMLCSSALSSNTFDLMSASAHFPSLRPLHMLLHALEDPTLFINDMFFLPLHR